MPTSRSRITRQLRPILGDDPLPIVIGLLLGGVSNALYDIVKDWLGSFAALLTLAVIVILGVLVILYVAQRRRQKLRITSESGVMPAPGLVVLVSIPTKAGVERTPAADALYYHCVTLPAGGTPTLRHCWLIYTDATEPYWQQIASLFKDRVTPHHVRVEDGESAMQTFGAMNSVYAEAKGLNLQPTDIIADCTGGTKPMSVGIALAVAAQQGCSLEYLPTHYAADGRPDFTERTKPRLVGIEFFGGGDEV